MKKIFSCILAFASIVIIDACQKPAEVSNDNVDSAVRVNSTTVKKYTDLSVKGDYEVRNGLLFFKDLQSFLLLDSTLRKIEPKQRIEFTNKLGFNSLLAIQDNLYTSLNEADSPSKYNSILAANQDIVKVNENKITSIFEDISSALLNRKGMVSIGGKVHCFVKGKTIVSSSEEDVLSTYKAGKQLHASTIILENKTSANARLASPGPCTSMNQTAYSSDNKRRVDVSVIIDRRQFVTGSDQYGDFVTLEYYSYVRGDPYTKNFFGNWTYYSTGNTLNSHYYAYIKVYLPIGSYPDFVVRNIEVNETHSNEATFIDYFQSIYTFYNVRANFISPTLGYNYDKSLSPNPVTPGKYTSGGVPNGVELTCP